MKQSAPSFGFYACLRLLLHYETSISRDVFDKEEKLF